MNAFTSLGTLSIGGLLLGALSAPFVSQDPKEAEILQLREDFHLAGSIGDYDLMHSLWTDDAVFSSPAGVFSGPDDITDFLASSPLWGTHVALTSESKTTLERRGNVADYAFECILVRVDGGDPLATSLSSIPPGTQNPAVEIVQHSSSQGVTVFEDGRWKFREFNGSGGPLP